MSDNNADDYRQAVLPGTSVHVTVCNRCGSMVLDQGLHDEWHKTLRASTGPMGFLSGGRL